MSEGATRISSRRRLSREQRRAELLEAALSAFAARGIGEARHAQIAELAGCSLSTVFVYFPTREELVAAVLEEVERSLEEMAESIHSRPEPVPDILRAHITAFADAIASSPDRARVWLDWSTATREDYWNRYLEFQGQMVERIAATIRRGQREGSVAQTVDAEADARLLVGSAHMIAQMQLTGRPAAETESFIDRMIEAALGV
jgi:TetR/AcrR family hemagglutinin/protease transcriptional regulator